MAFYAIWDWAREDWVREANAGDDEGGCAVLVFESKRKACQRAAMHFGFNTYSDAQRKDWCEVKKIN